LAAFGNGEPVNPYLVSGEPVKIVTTLANHELRELGLPQRRRPKSRVSAIHAPPRRRELSPNGYIRELRSERTWRT
jgi:hypothetical protein